MLNETGASRAPDNTFSEEEEARAVQKKLDDIARAEGVDLARQAIVGKDLKTESAHIDGMLDHAVNDLLGNNTQESIEHASDQEIEDVLNAIENPNRGSTAPLKGATGRLEKLNENDRSTRKLDI